jgi:hypothetical protein
MKTRWPEGIGSLPNLVWNMQIDGQTLTIQKEFPHETGE